MGKAVMPQVGDEVIIMSAPGRFRVVAVDGDQITIDNGAGLRRVVLAQAARRVETPADGSEGS
jgi:hypothetical protein